MLIEFDRSDPFCHLRLMNSGCKLLYFIAFLGYKDRWLPQSSYKRVPLSQCFKRNSLLCE